MESKELRKLLVRIMGDPELRVALLLAAALAIKLVHPLSDPSDDILD